MIEDIVGNNGTRFIIAAGAVALGLLCLVAVLRFMRNRPSSPFIRGGKNRQPRLAVLDAAAIDTRRRLVLVRRDDVEHLIMIGGPTDVVIESRIASQSMPMQQAAVTAAVAEPVAARPAVERRPAPQPETKAAPVSNMGVSGMGQVLYGESADAATPPTRAAQVRPQPESAAAVRQVVPERQVPAQPRPQPAATATTPPVSIETAGSPEDILDAARSRVLAANQPAALPRPVQAAPVTAAVQAPVIASQKDTSALEFERILDAEITGDLGKLTIDDVRIEADKRTNTVSPAPAARQEPRLGAQGNRTEPTLEDEMNRMLNEIAVTRKT